MPLAMANALKLTKFSAWPKPVIKEMTGVNIPLNKQSPLKEKI
jgi:hypothetical protein